MNILALDTSSSACTVALESNGIVKTSHQVATMQQGRLILPAIKQLLDEFSLSSRQLDAIAFGVGPGSFTGIRIASSVVQGLAYKANCQLYPVSSLALLAQTAYQKNGGKTQIVAVDARMGRLYLGVYRLDKDGVMTAILEDGAHLLESFDGFQSSFSVDNDCFGVGNGWHEFGNVLNQAFPVQEANVYSDILPAAEDLLLLAKSQKNLNPAALDPYQVLPKYFV